MSNDWRDNAKCVGVPIHIFFPMSRRHTENTWREARLLCERCPVKDDCLALAMSVPSTDDRWGMFGGKTPTERRALRAVMSRQ